MSIIQLYREHIAELVDEHFIFSIQEGITTEASFANAEARVIWIPVIKSQIGYMIALHEIAHVVLSHCDPWMEGNVFQAEAEAWNYALNKCKCEPSALTCSRILLRMDSYLDMRVELREKYPGFEPDPPPLWWEIYKGMEAAS